MRVLKNVYYGGKRRCLTMSYDDGTCFDRRLVEIFDANGIRGSFHLNSGYLGGICENPIGRERIHADELSTLFANHEISLHTLTHPSLAFCTKETMIREIMQDRENLEKYAGYPVRGMSYPNGSVNAEVIEVLRSCGVVCNRTTIPTHNFKLPENYMLWHPTCHHRDNAGEYLNTFLASERWTMDCLFVWGHSYEFDNHNNWDLIEDFCKRAAGDDATWYATNIEIYDYMQALSCLQSSADGRMLKNPCALDVWVSVDGDPVKIGAGETLKL